MKLSIVIPVYNNERNLGPLYEDLKSKVLDVVDYECEIVMVDDGSKDDSWSALQRLCGQDERILAIHLSKNFGSHSAILCGLEHCTGDCAAVKSADLQEPSELVIQMVDSWREGLSLLRGEWVGLGEGGTRKSWRAAIEM